MTLLLVVSMLPVVMRAQVRGRVESLALGHAETGIPMDAGGGLQRISLGLGEIGAGVIAASLRNQGVVARIDADTGGSFGGINATYTLLYRKTDELKVLDVIAKHLE